MAFLIKFLSKVIVLFTLEVGETISDAVVHLASPSKIGYGVVTQIDFPISEDDGSMQPKLERFIVTESIHKGTVSEI